VLLCVLALREVGGFGGFFRHFTDPAVAADFSLVKSPGQFPEDRFTWKWIVAIFVMQLYSQISISQSGRYLAARDGRDARRAAWLACGLMALGTVVWFIPPMVARFLFQAEVDALPVKKPAESAYVFMSLRLLSAGLMGVMIAAMFSATMSSMDTGLNDVVGTIIRNLVPRVREALKLPPLADRKAMLIARSSTVALGALIIVISLRLSEQDDFPLFDAYLVIASTVGIPLGFPMLAGLWVRRLPHWSFPVLFGACLAPSLYALYAERALGEQWTIQDRTLWIFGCGTVATFVCIALRRFTTPEHRERERRFFTTMLTPVDFAKEIGEARDYEQSWMLGNTALVMGALVALLMLLPNTWADRAMIGGIALRTALVGMALRRHARRCRCSVGLPRERAPEGSISVRPGSWGGCASRQPQKTAPAASGRCAPSDRSGCHPHRERRDGATRFRPAHAQPATARAAARSLPARPRSSHATGTVHGSIACRH